VTADPAGTGLGGKRDLGGDVQFRLVLLDLVGLLRALQQCVDLRQGLPFCRPDS